MTAIGMLQQSAGGIPADFSAFIDLPSLSAAPQRTVSPLSTVKSGLFLSGNAGR